MSTQQELQKLWNELEKRLALLIASFSAEINERERDDLNEFVENREYGIALEMLHATLIEQSIRPSSEQAREIQGLAALMSIDLSQTAPGGSSDVPDG